MLLPVQKKIKSDAYNCDKENKLMARWEALSANSLYP